jgi:5-dehydro-4-deoxyglucarate dehydratase
VRFDGVLFFPVTAFNRSGDVDEDRLAQHVQDGLASSPGGVFAACGTGEFHAMSLEEYDTVVRVAVEATSRRVPVYAGAGGPVGLATKQAELAAAAGADGLLVFPPYLVSGPPDGARRYIETIADASDLPLVLYQRGGVRYDEKMIAELARDPRVVGLKDGLGDLEHMHRIVLAVRDAVGDDFAFFNGMPTAEMSVAAYRGIGVDLYSSAAFAFCPEVATAFHQELGVEEEVTRRLLREFYAPLVRLRDRVPGYGVSLVKAGVRLRGLDVGKVRAPLVEPTNADLAELSAIIEAGLRAVKQ